MRHHLLLLFIASIFQMPDAVAASAPADTLTYVRREVMIPMRDGVKLNTIIYSPRISEKVPVLMLRTPYGLDGGAPNRNSYVSNMAAEGYIFVYQNVRGHYRSEGKYIMNGPVISDGNSKATDEATDTYDTVAWLIKNAEGNNGKVGQYGISYPGWTTEIAASRPHPAMKAASPQAEMSDLFLGDDFHHNGAFRLSYAFEYAYSQEISGDTGEFPFDRLDTYDWYLQLGPLSNANTKYFHQKVPSWNAFMEHPDYDAYWQKKSPLSYVDYPRIPVLHVGGYWDQEDIMGAQLMYKTMEKKDTNNRNYLLMGPWFHGQWSRPFVDKIGRYDMGSNTALYFKDVQKKWFDYWLKGKGDGRFSEAVAFQTGSNVWKTYAKWPPKEASPRKLYVQENGKASFTQPTTSSADAFDAYFSDPAKPVPYRTRPIEPTYHDLSRWRAWQTEDQRFVHNRPDVLSWETDTLTDNLTVTGSILAHLFASTTGSDADWVVKLIDVYPNQYSADPTMSGYQLPIASEVFRGRYRKSFGKPEPITPNQVDEYTVDLHQVNHVFRKGHRLMIQVQSTWFPVIDRNPQQYVPSIYQAKESDYHKATHRIFRNNKNATYLELPVMKD